MSWAGPVHSEVGEDFELDTVESIAALALVGEPYTCAMGRPLKVLDVLASGKASALPLDVLGQGLDAGLEGCCGAPRTGEGGLHQAVGR